ncbi:MAG: PmoA family protein [Verrucomicrobia bacterium]|nr:PmoA family protein [Verrucomicrobiota bacterium]MDA1069275.1 PmoA family protein [Verrucomicrobiota bacterium]
MKNLIVRSVIALTPVILVSIPLSAQVRTEKTAEAVHVFVSDSPVLTYNTETVQPPAGMDKNYARSGFIHPLYSPAGKVLTDAFPVGHVHQHAIFNAWTQTTFHHEVVDFWNQLGGTGTVKHTKLGTVKDNSFEAYLQQVSVKQGPAIDEEWEVKVRDSSDPFIIDIEIEQECATENEVYLHPYHYGGFAFRGSAHWSPEDEAHYEGSMKILTGQGVSSIEESNHTRPKWVAVYGTIDRAQAGFVIMDHPSNFRYPQPVRVHPKMPYFVFSPVIEGSFILKPGFTYTAQYRIVTFDGVPAADTIEKWYKAYIGKGGK